MRTNLSDQELWNAFRQNDENAFRLLFDRYWSRLFTTAFQYIKDREVCSEIVHDIFLNLWKNRQVLEIKSFKSYLTASTRYHTYRRLKKAGSSPLQYTDAWEEIHHHTSLNGGEEHIRSRELKNKVSHHLQFLPKRCREIFILSRMEHLSNEEIASRMRISKRTVENQITSALRYFRVVLKDIFMFIVLLKL